MPRSVRLPFESAGHVGNWAHTYGSLSRPGSLGSAREGR